MRRILFVAFLFGILGVSGCRTLSVTSEYGVNMAPNTHGQLIPTYSAKMTIKN